MLRKRHLSLVTAEAPAQATEAAYDQAQNTAGSLAVYDEVYVLAVSGEVLSEEAKMKSYVYVDRETDAEAFRPFLVTTAMLGITDTD